MKRFQIDCQLNYEIQEEAHFYFHIHVARHPRQRLLEESLNITPVLRHRPFIDETSGNRFFRLQAPKGLLKIHYRAEVEVQPQQIDPEAPGIPVSELPDAVLHYLLPTRYCESDLMGHAAVRVFDHVPATASAYQRVNAICDWLKRNVDYQLGASNSTTTARDVFVSRIGVCRDFSHLAITFCRALNIPARLVVGYVKFDEPPPDFHAIFEAYIDHQWVLFDPTGMAPTEDIVRIGTGRDAKDVAFSTIFGLARMTSMAPVIEPVPDPS